MGAARRLARVRREALAACMTCPLCRGLLREATAVALCLHTCKFPLLSPFLAVSVPFVRSFELSIRVRAGGRHGFPTRAAPSWSRTRGSSSPRVCVLRFGVRFFLFSRSDSPGDRAGVRCEFFGPRRVANAPPFAWIVVVPFIARVHLVRGGGHLPPRLRLLPRGRRCRCPLESRTSSGAGVSCPALPVMVLPTSPRCI
jgi:hypothetical protein